MFRGDRIFETLLMLSIKVKLVMKISLVSSSTRAGRASHRVGLLLKKQIEKMPGWSVSLIDLAGYALPVFQERVGYLEEVPVDVRLISEELKSSDGIIFITPEYNGGISSALKYVIDIFGDEEFGGKPIGVATASAGVQGGIRAALQLQQMILAIRAYPQPEMLLVPLVAETISESGDVSDSNFEVKVRRFIHSFLTFTSHLKQLRLAV